MNDNDPTSPTRFASVFGDVYSEPLPQALDAAGTGEQTVHLARLEAHRASGFSYNLSGPNCVMRWKNVPSGHRGAVDIVIHFHGYKSHNAMQLSQKAAYSGLDLGAVQRPTVGLVPHGHAFASRTAGMDGFNFPAISTRQELDGFIDDALAAFATLNGGARPTRGRVILTGHSGGGAALTTLMQSLGTQTGVHGFEFFDGTYGGQATLTQRHNWIEAAIERDAQALSRISGEAERRRYMDEQGSHVRIAFIDGTGTAAIARATNTFMRERLNALVSDETLRQFLRRYYRAQKVTHPAQVGHNLVPRTFGGRLLADGSNDLQPEATDLSTPAARAHSAYGLDAEAMDEITMPVLVTPERAADAPSGSAFIASIVNMRGVERENRIYDQIRAGNMPASLLMFQTVRTRAADRNGTQHDIEFYVMPDFVSIGRETDYVRIPMDPVTAQRVADHFDCLLPTARMVEQTYQAAQTKLTFIYGNYANTPRAHLQDASQSYLDHSRAIDAQLHRPPTILTSGHKKELVIAKDYILPRRNKETGEVRPKALLTFYGAYTAAGEPMEAPKDRSGHALRGHPSHAHEPTFVDYSHGVRLVWTTMKVDGRERSVADVLRDPNLATLISAEGPIVPRYTLDRSGRVASARAQQALSADPLALNHTVSDAFDASWGEALGYGTVWDERIRTTVEGFLGEFTGIPLRIGSSTLRIHPPYFMNVGNPAHSGGRTAERHRVANQHRTAAPRALRDLIGESRFRNARVGKSLPQDIRDFLQAAADRNLLQADATVGSNPTAQNVRAFLVQYGIGIDCSGFVSQAINRVIALFPSAAATDRIADPYNTGSAALKGGTRLFDRVSHPGDLCAGDTMWKEGHIRILAWAERRGDRYFFATAESSSVSDVGPSMAYWRLIPDSRAGAANFTGYRLQRSSTADGPGANWHDITTTHVYGHFKPLVRLLQAQGVTPSRAADAGGGSSTTPRSSTPAPPTTAPSRTTPPRTPVAANTSDLTQDEVNRLAAVTFTNAGQIDTFFHRQGNTGFIDWYNANLATTAPFSARGRIATSQEVRTRFTTFWDQIAVAFDRAQISLLELAATMAISINETSGNMWAHPESSGRGGGGRSDARGRHPGLAYFFDRIELQPNRWKASYNHLSGGRRASDLFNDADFIRAHGSLGNGSRLAHHGTEFNGAWSGDQYPQGQFTTDESAANGFIMQADFYKFRGRGIIQTTGRSSYLRVIRYIQGYTGSNSVLLDFKRQWTGVTPDVVATTTRTEDWDRIFAQSVILAKGLSLHAGTSDDYRRMSTTASVLMAVPPAAHNPRGQTGSIYAMGRRISGSHAYGSGVYKQRVLALLHGMLALA